MLKLICQKYKTCNQTEKTCRHSVEHTQYVIGCEQSRCLVLDEDALCVNTRKLKLKQLENELNKKR